MRYLSLSIERASKQVAWTSSSSAQLQQLPNELLLGIFFEVARIHPESLLQISAVCRHWSRLMKAYEHHLWRIATLSAFPGSSIRHGQGEGHVQGQAQGWKQTFRIQSGWMHRKAQTMVLRPCRPPLALAMTLHDLSGDLAMQQVEEQEQESNLEQSYHHHHHTHQHHLQDHLMQGEEDAAAAPRDVALIHEPAMVRHSRQFYPEESSSSSPSLSAAHPSQDNGFKCKTEVELEDSLSCSLCTYADLCLIPQARICVRTHRNRARTLMQVLNWSMRESVDVEDVVNSHHDLVSGMAVNDQGTVMVSCSIDGTVRVWDVDPRWISGYGIHGHEGEEGAGSFGKKVKKYGCPIQSRIVLLGHIGWVNAVAIDNTTVVSGGSDHTVRVWDALTGRLLRLIPNLFISREIGLGVYAVAIHESYGPEGPHNVNSSSNLSSTTLIGSGSIIEGYQIHDLNTGKLVMDLDEPLSSRDHVRFETALYQQYASRIVITDTVVVTNSKMEGYLCVWSREMGQFLYRIRVSSPKTFITRGGHCRVRTGRTAAVDHSLSGALKRVRGQTTLNSPDFVRMVTYGASESSVSIQRAEGLVVGGGEVEETVHTFRINKSGSMLMCTLCDGRVSVFEFGMTAMSSSVGQANSQWEVQASGHGTLMPMPIDVMGLQVHQQHPEEEEHQCGSLAWIWTRDIHGHNRVILV